MLKHYAYVLRKGKKYYYTGIGFEPEIINRRYYTTTTALVRSVTKYLKDFDVHPGVYVDEINTGTTIAQDRAAKKRQVAYNKRQRTAKKRKKKVAQKK